MTVNRTTLLDLPLPVTGTESGTWGDTTNNGLTQYMDIAIAGMSNLTSANFTAGALTIETTEGDSSATNISATSAQYAGFRVSSLAVNSTITVGNTGTSPARSYRLINADATYSLTFKATGQTGVTLLPGQSAVVAFNGTDYVIVGVVGAGSTTDNTVPRFDGTTGEILQSSGVTIDDSNNVSGVAQLNITTLDATNIEVTNIKAKDGTAAASIADSTGVVSITANPTLSAGTANGVLYLNGSKVATSGTALAFNGTTLSVTGNVSSSNAGNENYFLSDGSTRSSLQHNSNSLYYNVNDNSATSGSFVWRNTNAFSELMRLTSTGLGIGTSSPTQQLTVGGTGNILVASGATFFSSGRLYIRSGSGQPLDFGANDTNSLMQLDSSGNLGLGVTPSAWGASSRVLELPNGTFFLNYSNSSQAIVGANSYFTGSNWIYKNTAAASNYEQSSGAHKWFNAPSGTAGNAITFSQAMTLDASGNLGVGTTSPGARLDLGVGSAGVGFKMQDFWADIITSGSVVGSRYYYGASTIYGRIYANATGFNLDTSTAAVPIVFGTNNTERARITSGGDLGVGTTSPTRRLDVYGSGQFKDASGIGTTIWSEAVSGAGGTGTNTNHPFAILTNGTERARITSGGDVYIGATTALSSTAKLQISNGTGRAIATAGSTGDVGTEALRIGKFDNDSTTSQLFVRFTINNDGSGSGQINANGASAAAFGTYSDARLKENIVSLPSQLSNICALRPVEFDYKDGSGHQIGFIAQEMQAVYPDVVAPGDDEMLMVTGWSKTEARLVKAIQEQQALITSLTARVALLEGN